MTDSFGTRLRRQRERRHITLAQIAASTKIKASLFEGLERDDVSKWPGGIFRRSFVRAYAQAIGLNPEAVCREFLERFPDPDSHLPAKPPASPAAPAPAGRPAVPAAVAFGTASSEPDAAQDGAGLRLVLADTSGATPRPASVQPATPGLQWRAVALDLGLILVVAISAFVILDRFWMPLALSSVFYYFASTLLVGHTPGMALFVRAPGEGRSTDGVLTSQESSLDRALALRHELSEPSPAAARPQVTMPVPVERADDASAADGDGDRVPLRGRAHRARPPVAAIDIGSRRARA